MKKFLFVFVLAVVFVAIVPLDVWAENTPDTTVQTSCRVYEDNIETLREFWKDKCWYCPFFGLLLGTAQTVGHSVFDALVSTGYLTNLMGAGFLLWIAYKVFILVGGMASNQADKVGPEFIKDMIYGLFRLAVAYILLRSGIEFLWDLLVNTIAKIGLDIAQIIVHAGDTGNVLGAPPAIGATTWTASSGSGIVCNVTGQARGFAALECNFMYVMYAINYSASRLFSDGWGIKGYALANAGLWCVIPQFIPLLISLVYMFLGLYIWFTVPFKMIDAVFQLIVMAVILPLLVVAWVFPYTRQFAAKGLQMLIAAIGVFITVAIVIAIVAALLNSLLGNMQVTTISALMEGMMKGAGGADGVDTGTAKTLLSFLGVAFFGYKAFGSITDLSNTIFGPVVGAGGQQIERIATGAVMGGALGATTNIGGAIENTIRRVTGLPPRTNTDTPLSGVPPVTPTPTGADAAPRVADTIMNVSDSTIVTPPVDTYRDGGTG
ncbi:MAG: hypothetical protein FWF01_02140 [Alphaproteobacteria bacterium]|nr:hypothetical protein [Alphaproteobacteria bacterium]